MRGMHAFLAPSTTADGGDSRGTAGVLSPWLHAAGRCSQSSSQTWVPPAEHTYDGQMSGAAGPPCLTLRGQPCTASLTGGHRQGSPRAHMVHALLRRAQVRAAAPLQDLDDRRDGGSLGRPAARRGLAPGRRGVSGPALGAFRVCSGGLAEQRLHVLLRAGPAASRLPHQTGKG